MMYFYQVIKMCDVELVVREFLLLCEKSLDINLTEKKIRDAIISFDEIRVNTSDTEIIKIERAQIEDEEYDNVYLFDLSDGSKYGLEINPWANTLGYSVDENSLSFYGCEKFSALVLWEMTWFGFDEKTIQDHVKSWEEESNDELSD